MKRFISLALVFVLALSLVSSVASAAVKQTNKLMTYSEFQKAYTSAAKQTKSGSKWDTKKISFTEGDVNDVWQVKVNDYCIIQLQAPAGTKDIAGVLMLCSIDGSEECLVSLLYTMCEIGLATGALDSVDEMGEFLEAIGIFSDEFKDGGEGELVVYDVKYGWSLSSLIGFMFYAEPV